MDVGQSFESNGKSDIIGSDDIVNTEFSEFDGESEFLNGAGIFSSSGVALVGTFGTCADHFAGGKNEGCGFGVSNSHDQSSKSFGIVFGVSSLKCDFLQIELTLQIGG